MSDMPRGGTGTPQLARYAGFSLLAWQGVAGLLMLTGQADLFLASWPDPAWFAMMAGMFLSPPPWLALVAIVVGGALVVRSFRRRAPER